MHARNATFTGESNSSWMTPTGLNGNRNMQQSQTERIAFAKRRSRILFRIHPCRGFRRSCIRSWIRLLIGAVLCPSFHPVLGRIAADSIHVPSVTVRPTWFLRWGPSAHIPCLATLVRLGRISRSSGIVRFVQGGVVKTFRWADPEIQNVT